jgi:hypothetical protein
MPRIWRIARFLGTEMALLPAFRYGNGMDFE